VLRAGQQTAFLQLGQDAIHRDVGALDRIPLKFGNPPFDTRFC
jgi:hypothetical protein